MCWRAGASSGAQSHPHMSPGAIPPWGGAQAFAGCLVFFHVSEFLLACIYMRDELSWRSWLVSKPYAVAMSGALLEYAFELWLAPGMKQWGYVAWLGLALVVLGEAIRKAGMLTAKASFTHNIRHSGRPEHRLVTWGIYRHVRHPGYLGWYMWCVGTQLLLCNPASAIAFAVVAWRFFKERIVYEEHYLRKIFGDDYATYAARTPTFLPFMP